MIRNSTVSVVIYFRHLYGMSFKMFLSLNSFAWAYNFCCAATFMRGGADESDDGRIFILLDKYYFGFHSFDLFADACCFIKWSLEDLSFRFSYNFIFMHIIWTLQLCMEFTIAFLLLAELFMRWLKVEWTMAFSCREKRETARLTRYCLSLLKTLFYIFVTTNYFLPLS